MLVALRLVIRPLVRGVGDVARRRQVPDIFRRLQETGRQGEHQAEDQEVRERRAL